ncbi:MAG: serine/threonine protein kinase [Pirellulales bacterium]|nr:serine/threonine protein kinase [Pirellulales bacterium]
MKVPPAEFEPESRPEAALRFTYPSGSRPLEGYTIKRGVGRGGFGEVYFAVSDAGKEVALKLIRRNLDVELRGVRQCLNLKHQNLVALYDIRSDEIDDRWVVMEYVSGESLEDVIDRHPEGMPHDLLLHWFSGIAAGVAYLHDHGIVHRDLKPANIFLDDGVVKIGDYGLSKFISCSRRSGQTESVGTVHYMAPEIANGRYGKEIDTYALGIILYEMLTGHVPFQGESVGEVLMKHLTAEPDLSLLADPYRGIVERAMAKDPELRLKSVAEMLQALPVQSAETVVSIPPAAKPERPSPSEAPVATSAETEEPIAAAVRDGWHSLLTATESVHPLVKALGGFLMIAAAIFTIRLWLGPALVLGFVYLVYRAVRAVVTQPDSPSSALTASPSEPSEKNRASAATEHKQAKRHYARRRRHTWQRQLQQHVAAKPLRDRVTELLGSMIVAAVIASLLAIFACAMVSSELEMAIYLWMAIVATVGSWAVMIPAKLTEGHVEDQAPLRFGMLIAGAAVGILAWVMSDGLSLGLPVSRDIAVGPWDTLAGEFLRTNADTNLSEQFRRGAVQLTLPVSTAYFAFLFVVLRWWRQAEYARAARVSIWSIIKCGIVGFLMTFIWWFPQPLGAVLAAMVACTTQLASPWMPPSRRRALAEQGA